jgi:hypothetical protein
MIYHVFANKSNVGDWLSARAIQHLLGFPDVVELHCDAAFVAATLKQLASANPKDLIIIGGGGLFQEYFVPFWKGFEAIAQRVPFCIWGVNVRPLPDFRALKLDVAVFSGVLEYLTQLESVAHWLAGQVSHCVASYACANSMPGTSSRANEIRARSHNGWVNTYGEFDLLEIFESAGFVCRRRDSWESQRIFVLHR